VGPPAQNKVYGCNDALFGDRIASEEDCILSLNSHGQVLE